MFEQLFKKLATGIGKAIGIADERIAAFNDKTIATVKERITPAATKFADFVLARPADNYVQETYPYIVLAKKRIKNLNLEVSELTKMMGEQHFDILTPQEKELPLKMIEAFDKIRNLGEGIRITPLKYQNKELSSFEDLSKFIKENIPNLNEKQKGVIEAFKGLSDEMGVYQTMNAPDELADLEGLLKNKISQVSGREYLDKLENLRQEFNNLTGIDMKFWNMYYPHIQEWKLPMSKTNVEFLKMVYPDKAKDLTAFWEKQRKGLPTPYIEDPEIVYKTMLYNFTWLKKYREILENTLNSYDFFRNLNTDEIGKLVEHWNNKSFFPFSDRLFDAKKYLPEDIYKKFKELYPNEESFAIWHQTRPFSGKVKLGDEDINNLIELLTADIHRYRMLKSMGIEKKIYLIPEGAYKEFKSWGEDIFGNKPLYNPIKELVSGWKALVTAYTRFVPFRLTNTIGDIFNAEFKQPGEFTKLADALSISLDILRGKEISKEIPLISKQEFVNRVLNSGILKTFSGFNEKWTELGIIKREPGIIGGVKYIMDLINTSAEMTPKLASVLDNLERVSRGELPEFTGAEKYILSLVKKSKGLDDNLITAIFERGATITVDYSNIPVKYRKIMTEFLAPFSYWYVRTADQLGSMLLTKTPQVAGAKIAPGYQRWLYFYGLPLAASYYWNTSDPKRRAIWEALPPYLKITPLTIIAGIDKTTKKPIIISLYTPAQMVADFLGFDNLFQSIEKVKEGQWTAKDAAINYLVGTPLDVPKKYLTLLNPLINGIIGVAANKDLFTNQQIVPDDLIGTKYERTIQMNYFTRQSLLSPIIPIMIAMGANQPTDFIGSIYGDKSLSKAKDMFAEYLSNMIDVKKGLGIVPEEKVDLYLSRAAFEQGRKLEAKRNEMFENVYRDYIKYMIDKDEDAGARMRETLQKIADGEYNYLTLEDINNYFNRPSVMRRIIKDFSKSKDPDTIEKTNLLLNQLHEIEYIQKTAPKSIRDDLIEFLNELYD
jgi:hypothetical protein